MLRARALFDGPTCDVFVRGGEHNGDIYIDLGDAAWPAVRVSAAGWEIVADPPVRFRRSKGLLPMVEPVKGGRIGDLQRFVNVRDDDFLLLATALITSLWLSGPYVVIVLQGEQGSAKSTTARVIRALIDPNSAPLRAQPRDGHDLVIAASNGWLLAVDNISRVQPWLSDALCRLATGGGFATRELYSDDDEVLFDAQRPIILNGIEELATRSDLLDRALLFLLPHIPEGERMDEATFWSEFEAQHPSLFGALLDVLVEVIRTLPRVRTSKLPRQADFARRGAAAAASLGWDAEVFSQAYKENRQVGHVGAIEGSAVARALTKFMDGREEWAGTATELLEALTASASGSGSKGKGWPTGPQALSNALRRVVPNLREAGLDVDFGRESGRKRSRVITIRWARDEAGAEPSEESEVSETQSDNAISSDDPPDDRPVPGDEVSDGSRFNPDASDDPDASARSLLGEESGGPIDPDLQAREASAPLRATGAYRQCPGCNSLLAPPGKLCFRCEPESRP